MNKKPPKPATPTVQTNNIASLPPRPRPTYPHREGCHCFRCDPSRRADSLRQAREARMVNRKTKLTLREMKYVQAYTSPTSPTFMNKGQSRLVAGYASKNGSIAEGRAAQRAVIAAFEHLGINEAHLAKKLKEGLDAKKTEFFSYKGNVTKAIDCVDFNARHKYLETAFKVRGDIPREDVTVQTALILRDVPERPVDLKDWEADYARSRSSGPSTGD